MVDPIVLGLALTAAAAVVAVIFYLFSGGDNFDKVYDERAKQLLTGLDKEKKEVKKKTTKKRENKEKKAEASDKSSEASSVAESPKETPKETPKEQEQPVENASDENKENGEAKKKKNKKSKGKSPLEPIQPEVPSKDSSPKPAPVKEETSVSSETSPKKSKKTKKEKKIDEQDDSSEWISASSKKDKVKAAAPKESAVKVEEAAPLQKASPVSAEPAKSNHDEVKTAAPSDEKRTEIPSIVAKALTEGPLDIQKVLRVFSTDPILAKYAVFIKNYTEEKDKFHARAIESFAQTADQKTIEATKNFSTISAQHEQARRKLEAEKAETAEKLNSALAAIQTTERRAENAEKELQNRILALSATQQKLASIEKNTTSSQDSVLALEKKIAELEQTLSSSNQELSASKQLNDKHKEATAKFEEVAKGFEAEKEEIARQLNAKQEELVQLGDEKSAAENQHKELMEEYLKIQSLVEQLQAEVSNFEKMKDELNQKTKRFDEQEKKIASLEAAHNTMKKENDTLRTQVTDLTNKLSAPKSTNEDLGEEVVVLSRVSNQFAAPPSGNDSSLAEEINYLKEKNDELRARNFKLLEHLEKAGTGDAPKSSENSVPASVVGERTKAIAILKNLTNDSSLTPPNPKDCKAYSDWLVGVEKCVKATPKTENKKEKSKSSDDSEKYKKALSLLESELSRIESLLESKESTYEERIRKLESQLKTVRIPVEKKKKEAASDHSADELGWEVI